MMKIAKIGFQKVTSQVISHQIEFFWIPKGNQSGYRLLKIYNRQIRKVTRIHSKSIQKGYLWEFEIPDF